MYVIAARITFFLDFYVNYLNNISGLVYYLRIYILLSEYLRVYCSKAYLSKY